MDSDFAKDEDVYLHGKKAVQADFDHKVDICQEVLLPNKNIKYDKNQLAKGIAIEREHTLFDEIATIIAKHHLAEIPDYYTRLEQMEADAKK
jgi:hypothetical protein